MHPEIRKRCIRHLNDKDFDDAIRNALLAVEVAVRKKAGAPDDLVGVRLMDFAFRGENPCLRMASVKAEQEGIHLLYRGAIASFRNSFGHRFIDESDESSAVELMALASRLLKMLDHAERAVDVSQVTSVGRILGLSD